MPRRFQVNRALYKGHETALIMRIPFLTPPPAPLRRPFQRCPLCNSTALTPVVETDCTGHEMYTDGLPKTLKWVECMDCSHMFTDSYFTPEGLALLFRKTQASQSVGFDAHGQRHIASRMVSTVLPHVRAEGHWLDVGFGNGALLMAADEFGFTAVGLDLRVQNVERLRRLDFEAHALDVQDLPKEHDGRYCVVSMADVLEHMPYPGSALARVHVLLEPGGALLLSLPNKDSSIWKLMSLNQDNAYWREIEHYHNFGRKRLYRLLEDSGFEPVRYGVSERYRAGMEVVALRR